MKKHILATALVLFSATAFADDLYPVETSNFTGFGVGMDIGVSRYNDANADIMDVQPLKYRYIGDVELTGSYGFDYGEDFIGMIEARAKLGTSRIAGVTSSTRRTTGINGSLEEKNRVSVAYLQGYMVTPNFMPYAKLAYIHTRLRVNADVHGTSISSKTNAEGFGIGVGAKYAVNNNVEVGGEYLHTRFRGEKLKGNSLSMGATYRFR